jgi:uncharacterized damage-inducible protein DinB
MSADERPHPPEAGDERATLEGFLDFLRATVRMKVAGLTDEESRRHLLDSSPLMTPAGIVKHLTAVERWWFSHALANNRDLESLFSRDDHDFELRLTDEDTVAALLDAYDQECERSRTVSAAMDLDHIGKRPKMTSSLRWVLTHMIEETARHAGHLDFLRESIDGTTGE